MAVGKIRDPLSQHSLAPDVWVHWWCKTVLFSGLRWESSVSALHSELSHLHPKEAWGGNAVQLFGTTASQENTALRNSSLLLSSVSGAPAPLQSLLKPLPDTARVVTRVGSSGVPNTSIFLEP